MGRAAASFIVGVSLLVMLSPVARGMDREGEGDSRGQQNTDTCTSQTDTMSGSSLLVEAGATGSIRYKPVRFHQFFNKKCQTEKAARYRTADGSCNHPLNYGSANTPFKRLLPPLYGDGINSPRTRGKDGYPLPAATDVSRLVHTNESSSRDHTPMFMQWGQFTDHDITLTPVPTTPTGEAMCCGPNGTISDKLAHPDCFPIMMGAQDANSRFVGTCMSFVRSIAAHSRCGYQAVPREQVNELTAFMDGSNIYGSSQQLQLRLRETTADGQPGSKMKTERNGLLPNDNATDCHHRPEDYCFLAGDARVNVQPGLVAIHTMWVRLHNLVVDSIRDSLPIGTSEEDLFQEARKIVVAMYQNIHYQEWLPKVIGPTLHGRYRLYPEMRPSGRFGYSACVDPTILNEFATAAYRFGHSTLPDHLLVNNTLHRFRDLFFNTDLIFDDYDGVVQALVTTAIADRAQTIDRHMVDELTGHLFEPTTQEENAPSHGLDLAALNIQRGRDHGLRPYNDYRKACGLEPKDKFKDFGEAEKILEQLYRSVDDIDLFVGSLLETPEKDAAVGPTFACIMAQQFHALKYGDLFFFETDRQPGGFSDALLSALRKVRLHHVVCLTSEVERVPLEVFDATSNKRSCKSVISTFNAKILNPLLSALKGESTG